MMRAENISEIDRCPQCNSETGIKIPRSGDYYCEDFGEYDRLNAEVEVDEVEATVESNYKTERSSRDISALKCDIKNLLWSHLDGSTTLAAADLISRKILEMIVGDQP